MADVFPSARSVDPPARGNATTRLGVVVAFAAIALGPLYTDPGYSWMRNAVSELAGQETRNAWVMQVGLFAVGAGIVIDFLRSRHRADLPLLLFGIFIALTAVFPHRPFVEGRPFNETLDTLHSIFATLTGLAAVTGAIVRMAVDVRPPRKWLYATLATAYTVLPMMMTFIPSLTGVFQRLIFGSFFVWVSLDFPRRRDAP